MRVWWAAPADRLALPSLRGSYFDRVNYAAHSESSRERRGHIAAGVVWDNSPSRLMIAPRPCTHPRDILRHLNDNTAIKLDYALVPIPGVRPGLVVRISTPSKRGGGSAS